MRVGERGTGARRVVACACTLARQGEPTCIVEESQSWLMTRSMSLRASLVRNARESIGSSLASTAMVESGSWRARVPDVNWCCTRSSCETARSKSAGGTS